MWASVGSFSGGTGPRATVHVSGGPGRRGGLHRLRGFQRLPRLRPDRLWQSCYRTTACCTRLPRGSAPPGNSAQSGSQVLRPVRGNVRFFLPPAGPAVPPDSPSYQRSLPHPLIPLPGQRRGLTAPPLAGGAPAHWASGLLPPGRGRRGTAAPAPFLLVQRQVGQAPHIVPVPHGLGPRLRGQCAEGPQHPPAQPVRAPSEASFLAPQPPSCPMVRGGFSSRLNWLQVLDRGGDLLHPQPRQDRLAAGKIPGRPPGVSRARASRQALEHRARSLGAYYRDDNVESEIAP